MATTIDKSIEPLSDASALPTIVLQRLQADCVEREVISIRREPSAFATVFPAERLFLTLDDGQVISLFAKHMGDQQANHPDKQQRDRETLVYENLLSAGEDYAPKYFGTYQNPLTGCREIYLEYVDDWNLKYHELEHWYAAARALAKFQTAMTARRASMESADYLLHFDEAYFHVWARIASEAVRAQAKDLSSRMHALHGKYDRAAHLLASQPATLVHNDLSPKNVIADRSLTPARICFVDWEMAGAGCGLLDLVHLKYGLEPEADARMVATYREAAAGSGLLPEDDRAFARLHAACELHKTLYRLAHCAQWQFPAERVAPWVDDAEKWLARATD